MKEKKSKGKKPYRAPKLVEHGPLTVVAAEPE